MPSALSILILKMIARLAQSLTLGTLDHFSHFTLILLVSRTLFKFEILFPFCTTFEKLVSTHFFLPVE